MEDREYYLGVFEGHNDPAVALVRNGEIIAYAEEERHIRFKHARRIYPIRALRYCLDFAGIGLEDVSAVAANWDIDAHTDGRMARFFEQLRAQYAVDAATVRWQNMVLGKYNVEATRKLHETQWRRAFGEIQFPRIMGFPHHYTHAFHAAAQSGFDRSVTITIDGSGDQHCTVLWRHEGTAFEPIREIKMPHSLGWVYTAFTEYLGFEANDGEYKVMGLAAYGRPSVALQEKVDRIVQVAPDGIEYRIDPSYIHYGEHTWSGRYTDKLCELFGRPPRLRNEDITDWHQALSFAVQFSLEKAVKRLVRWAIQETGMRKICVGGGVGQNIKMNSQLFQMPEVEDLFAQPLCNDSGAAAGAALAAWSAATNKRPARLRSLSLGYEESEAAILQALEIAQLRYERPPDICEAVADELQNGRIVGWVQGRMEAGPRALGNRSILADPRSIANRDRVNAIVKFREHWRPFCPSMIQEAASRYFDKSTFAPFMIMAFPANERLKEDAPAIVHVDGTSRVQFVQADVNPRYYQLLKAFERRTGVPVLLNTSFNVKGEPIVCTVHDALRTFWATGLEVLAIGDFLIRKRVLEPVQESGAGETADIT